MAHNNGHKGTLSSHFTSKIWIESQLLDLESDATVVFVSAQPRSEKQALSITFKCWWMSIHCS